MMKPLRKEDTDAPLSGVSDAQFAGYCHAMLEEMRDIASHRRLDHLAQFLSVCTIEALRIQGPQKRKMA
jgi:hypothetical protein